MEYRTHEIGEFLDEIASSRVAPAGGSAAALTGAFGAALAEMAAHHSLRKHSDTAPGDLTLAQERLSQQRTVLLRLSNEDADAIEALFGDQAANPEEATVSRVAGIPLSIAEACVTVLEEANDIADSVADSVRQDLHTALYLTVGAAWASIRTVESNLDRIEDAEIRTELANRVDATTERLRDAVGRTAETTGVEWFD